MLLVEDSQGKLPDIRVPYPHLWVSVSLPSRLDQLGGLGALGDQPLNQASPDEPKVKLHEMEFPVRPLHVSGIRPQTPLQAPTHVGTPETSSQGEKVPLFFGARQEAETIINPSLQMLIKGKVIAFSSPSLNLSRDRAAGDGTVSAFTVCLSLCALLLRLVGNLAFHFNPRPSLPSHGSLLVASALVAFKCSIHACEV